MTDTWVYLIREPDWDSDKFLPEQLAGTDRRDVDETMAAHGRFQQAVAEVGAKIVAGHALQNRKYGGVVKPSADGGEAVYSDASLTDSSEVITGFYAVECDEGTARKLAALVPTGNVIEWRKVHPFE